MLRKIYDFITLMLFTFTFVSFFSPGLRKMIAYNNILIKRFTIRNDYRSASVRASLCRGLYYAKVSIVVTQKIVQDRIDILELCYNKRTPYKACISID